MSSFITGIGKGLKEPISPYRSAYFFGAELNSVNADNWNYIPTVWDPTTIFDLSGMEKGHEVVVALLGLTGTGAGTYNFTFEWYRDRDNALLYRFPWSMSLGAGSWVYSYSYIGYVDWEIIENGRYHLDIIVTGREYFSRTLGFSISGIPEVIPPAPVPGNFLDPIFSIVWDLSGNLKVWADSIWTWIPGYEWFHDRFYNVADFLWNLLTPIANFGDWVDDVASKVSSLLSQADILGFLRTWLTYAENAWNWVANAWQNVTRITNTWWSSASQVVMVWVNDAKVYAAGLVTVAVVAVTNLQTAWDAFKGKIPSIDAAIAWWSNWTGNLLAFVNKWWNDRLLDIQGLINSAFTRRESLWVGWQDSRDQVIEFFTDPLEFLWTKFTDWFLGPEV